MQISDTATAMYSCISSQLYQKVEKRRVNAFLFPWRFLFQRCWCNGQYKNKNEKNFWWRLPRFNLDGLGFWPIILENKFGFSFISLWYNFHWKFFYYNSHCKKLSGKFARTFSSFLQRVKFSNNAEPLHIFS